MIRPRHLAQRLTAITAAINGDDRPAILLCAFIMELGEDRFRFSSGDKSVLFGATATPDEVAEVWEKAEPEPGSTRRLLDAARHDTVNPASWVAIGEY